MRNTMRAQTALFAILLGVALPAVGQEPSSVLSPAAVSAIGERVEADIAAGAVAGAVVLIADADEVLMLQAYGSRELGGAPMEPDAIFRIYSMTKPITSVAVMILHERGHFDLDDPVAAYLPELADVQVGYEVEGQDGEPALVLEPADRPITIRDLLRHTSGMTYGFFGDSLVDRRYRESGMWRAASLESMVEQAGELPLKHQPGKVFEYGISTDVLARLVEVVAQQPFMDFLEANILGPLGMTDTAYWVSEDKIDRLAGYYRATDSGLEVVEEGDAYRVPPAVQGGGAGLTSTAADYLRFCRMILGGGMLDGVRVLRAETVAQMGEDHLRDLPGVDGGDPGGGMVGEFGLGFALTTPENGPVPPGLLFWSGIASTAFWIDSDNGLIVIYMAQRAPFTPELALGVRNAFYRHGVAQASQR